MLPSDRYRIVRSLNRKGDYIFHVEMKRFGLWWKLAFGGAFRNGYVVWGGNRVDSFFCAKYFKNEKIARDYLIDSIWHHGIKNYMELKRKKKIAEKKANAHKVIDFP